MKLKFEFEKEYFKFQSKFWNFNRNLKWAEKFWSTKVPVAVPLPVVQFSSVQTLTLPVKGEEVEKYFYNLSNKREDIENDKKEAFEDKIVLENEVLAISNRIIEDGEI